MTHLQSRQLLNRSPSVRWALASLSLAMLLSSLGTSIANVGLPTLAQAFSASFQQVQWVVIAYLLAITTLIVSVGRLGDIWSVGAACCCAGIALFTVASACAALAPTSGSADRGPGAAGPGRRNHDGADHGACRRDGGQGQDRQRHGPAGDDVGRRHRAGPVARRCADRRVRLAVDVPHQRAAGHGDMAARASLLAR